MDVFNIYYLDKNENEISYLLDKYIKKINNGSDELKEKCEEFISTIKNNESYLVLLDGVKEVFN